MWPGVAADGDLSSVSSPFEPGDNAPDFTLLDQHGEPFTLSEPLEHRKARHLVYFYPEETRS